MVQRITFAWRGPLTDAWDGGDHAFLIDTKARGSLQNRGIGACGFRPTAAGLIHLPSLQPRGPL